MEKNVQDRINSWLNGPYDEETKKEIKALLDSGNEKELTDAFYRDLEFGTGGLRGIMGVGTNRMNKYTVGVATQGLANYILKQGGSDYKVAIGYDSRNNSDVFSKAAAEILSSNGISVYLYDDIHPISLLSYAVRSLGCIAGVVVTASHNPKEYNGYKVYWTDGAQVIPPHDKNIIEEVLKVKPEEVKTGDASRVTLIGKDIEDKYMNDLMGYLVNPDIIKKHHDIKIVYTPIHGSGYKMVPMALRKAGFTNLTTLEGAQPPNGNFPTVESPNPENPEALQIAVNKAKEIGAELVMGTDPDCDRMGCALLTKDGSYMYLTGNQIGSIISYYLITNKKNVKDPYIVKTIVTTELARAIADANNVKLYDVLTGFKWIADIIERTKEGTYLFGFEESFGYCINSNVRDKDGVSSCLMLAEVLAYCKDNNMTLADYLESIYEKYGYFYEETISITKKGADGAKAIADLMTYYRNNLPKEISGVEVVSISDYEKKEVYDNSGKKISDIALPKSNVLQYILADKTKITVRPSGTEPKIKFYFEVCVKESKDKRVNIAKEKVANFKKFIKE
ncbi:phospho-sugar mutase [Brachyspira pilosicoli]|uniref:Phosphoglucomutase n=2 Tax=Brachyspira pilosicoli TaxID=52584 RepID=A0A3B6VVH3_BRAPL|nr:phospho-sugar mutase [Brachyspira pilosicoli]AGA67045.1 phosphoglucomutase [Brachyspira pilosicoli P43/6/78]MBW5398650.1 phospho-sugar mutase [Brachyspira pilosicoli]WIH80845.1 phospho-sugar mutase [Brachyspira pilosicoli]WIH83052.1 phospho-sugar mutase [Brachyspira pilosicoli]WIH85286.1 phospho-sugar mutase [Brachyspira pilosicoli]